MRGLAGGKNKDFAKLRKQMQENFVFLNVYCKSVKDEHDPRGPEGPYRFKDRSVPVYVIKAWDGETFSQKLGFVADEKAGLRNVARDIENALKKNGPVMPPKALRPLKKNFDKGMAYLEKKRPGYAWKEFAKVVEVGTNEKKFPKGEPSISRQAKERMTAIETEAKAALDEAENVADPKKAKTAIRKVLRDYGKIPDIASRAREAIKNL